MMKHYVYRDEFENTLKQREIEFSAEECSDYILYTWKSTNGAMIEIMIYTDEIVGEDDAASLSVSFRKVDEFVTSVSLEVRTAALWLTVFLKSGEWRAILCQANHEQR